MKIPKEKESLNSEQSIHRLTPASIINAASTAYAIINQIGEVIEVNKEFNNLLPNLKPGSDISKFVIDNKELKKLTSGLQNKSDSIIVELFNNKCVSIAITLTKLETEQKEILYLAAAKREYRIENNMLIQQLIDNIPDNIFIKDRESKFIMANNWVAKIMGANSPENLIGKDDYDLIPKNLADIYFEDEQYVIKTGKPIVNKQERVIVNGKNRWYSTTKIPLYDEVGQIAGIMGVGKDITQHIKEKKALEKAWQEADKADKLKSAFLANLSHEIRTPLNGILGFSQFLKQKSHTKEKQHKYLDIIHNNGKQLLMLLNDIIDISMIESNQISIKKQVFRVNGLLTQLFTNFDHQLNSTDTRIKLKLNAGFDDTNDLLFSDDHRIHQILGNLIANAIKFTKDGTIEIGYTLENDLIKFFVADTGIGIEPEVQKEVFKRFRQADESLTRKYGGTGLGLSICKGLVEKLGGDIWVESIPKVGSTFYFTIPYLKEATK